MVEYTPERLARLTGMLKRRGIILPAFEIHGGAAGLYDFGPVGGRLRNRCASRLGFRSWGKIGGKSE